MRPLDGITVVSLEQAVAAPFCTRQLADYGARVIKIERPGEAISRAATTDAVNGLSSYFVWLNRSKESVTLDVKQPAGARRARRAARARRRASCRTSARARRRGSGSTSPTLSRAISRGSSSSTSRATATAARCQPTRKRTTSSCKPRAGSLSVTGSADTPSRAGVSIADIAAGMYAYSGTLMALLQRDETGRGTRVDVSMLEALGGVDEPADLLRATTAGAAGAQRRLASDDRTVRPAPRRRRPRRLVRHSERPRVDAVLRRRCSGGRSWRATSASPTTPRRVANRAELTRDDRATRSRRCRPRRSCNGSTRRTSRTDD